MLAVGISCPDQSPERKAMTLGSHFLYGHLNIQFEMNLNVSFCGSVFKNRTDKQLCDMARTNK